jgi:hypothetical protein
MGCRAGPRISIRAIKPIEAALLSGRLLFIAAPLPDSQIQRYAGRQSDCSDHHVDGEEPDEVKRVAFIGDELPVGRAGLATIRGEQLARCVRAVQFGEPVPGHKHAGGHTGDVTANRFYNCQPSHHNVPVSGMTWQNWPLPKSKQALTLQLRFLPTSESMGNHDSKIVDAGSVD